MSDSFRQCYKIIGDGVAVLEPEELRKRRDFIEYLETFNFAPNLSCCGFETKPVYNCYLSITTGFYCPHCREYYPAIGRERKLPMEIDLEGRR